MIPEVSAIVPTFNRHRMVVEAIASVLAQREVRFELIVIDDGSTDGTSDALEEALAHTDAPVRVIQTENRGAAAARNLGVEAAAAPLIAFLDSDDTWNPEKLAHQMGYMHAHREYQISQCDELWIRNERRVNPGLRHRKRAGDIFLDSLRTCLISPSAVMISTDLFRNFGGFDESMQAAEDYDLWLRILLRYQVGLLEETLVTRRAGHAGQLSATVPGIDRFRILALTKLLADSDLTGAKRVATAQVLAEKCRIYAGGLRRRHRDAGLFEQIAERDAQRWADGPDESMERTIFEIKRLSLQDISCARMQ